MADADTVNGYTSDFWVVGAARISALLADCCEEKQEIRCDDLHANDEEVRGQRSEVSQRPVVGADL